MKLMAPRCMLADAWVRIQSGPTDFRNSYNIGRKCCKGQRVQPVFRNAVKLLVDRLQDEFHICCSDLLNLHNLALVCHWPDGLASHMGYKVSSRVPCPPLLGHAKPGFDFEHCSITMWKAFSSRCKLAGFTPSLKTAGD